MIAQGRGVSIGGLRLGRLVRDRHAGQARRHVQGKTTGLRLCEGAFVSMPNRVRNKATSPAEYVAVAAKRRSKPDQYGCELHLRDPLDFQTVELAIRFRYKGTRMQRTLVTHIVLALFCCLSGLVCSVRAGLIHDAVVKGDVDKVRALLDQDPRLIEARTQDQEGETPLHDAARWERKDIVQLLLERGADVNAKTKGLGYTPLHITAARGNQAIADLLLAKGADINAQSTYSGTPLFFAETPEMINYLVKRGGAIGARDRDLKTSLHRAALNGYVEVCKALIDTKADVNAADINGVTPLHWAAGSGHLAVVKLLLDNKADVNRVSRWGTNALLHATWGTDRKELVELLISKGAKVHQRGSLGETPLSGAVGHGDRETFELLLRHNLDLNGTNEAGFTLLHIAVRGQQKEMVQRLLELGLSPALRDKKGLTPLDHALNWKLNDIADILRPHAATAPTSRPVR